VIEEGHAVGLRDMADMRAAVGLADEPLGWPQWIRSARYFVRYYRKSGSEFLRRRRRELKRVEALQPSPIRG
jgi:hypothetical protein